MTNDFYPKGPASVPPGFTQLPSSYKTQVVYVLLAMVVFLALYLTMVSAAGFLVYLAVIYPMETFNRWTILLKLGTIAMAVMLFGFLLKFLLKKHDTDSPLNVEVTADEHPRLFAFIEQLCDETNAPMPHKVYVNHEINACVFYNSTVLSLFLPVKKNLLIGLGLVNTLNLSEFKAVLAHEFGHFSQSSMKLGSYVYMANSIIHSMVYDRDKWDDLLESWKGSNFQLAVFGWILTPVVWAIRKFMSLIYQGINLVHASLSRQMEYNADRVAVSVSGSDAIINALYRLGTSGEAFNYSNAYLSTAIDNNVYTSNLFYHHSKATAFLSETQPEFREMLLENRAKLEGVDFLFKDTDGHLVEMYESHPSNYKREQNAKETYLQGTEDNRSSWLLFDNAEKLAEHVTQNLLRVNLQLSPNIKFTPAPEVQAYLDAEQQETTYHLKYQGIYDNRLLSPLNVEQPENLVAASGVAALENLAVDTLLYGAELKTKADSLAARMKDVQTLSLILQKQDKRKSYELSNGYTYEPHEAQALLDQRLAEFEEDKAWYAAYDTKVFAVHYLLTADKPETREDLLLKYLFITKWVKLAEQWQQQRDNFQEILNAIVAKGNTLTEKELKAFIVQLMQGRTCFRDILLEADTLTFPAMQNMQATQSVKKFLLAEELASLSTDTLEAPELNALINQITLVEERIQRIYYKALGSILQLQETLVAQTQEAKEEVY